MLDKGSNVNVICPSVTVVIVHHHGLEMLERCLDSLIKTNYNNMHIVLVDNGSSDGTVDFMNKVYGDQVEVIRSEVNLGFVGGNNIALQVVKSKYVVMMNDDTVVTSNWLKFLVEVAEENPSVGACQPKLLSLANPRFFDYSGAAGGMLDVHGVPFCRGRIFDSIEIDKGQYDKNAEIFWACGAAILIRNEILGALGFLDEIFFAHMEEIDLCWGLQLLGYKVMSVPLSLVYHVGGGTALQERLFLKHRNNLFLLVKNFSASSLLKYLPRRVFLDLFAFLFFLIKDVSRSLCIVKAYLSMLKNLKKVILSRYLIQEKRNVTDSEIIKGMVRKSVVIQYYLLGRRCFSQIQGLPYRMKTYIANKLKS